MSKSAEICAHPVLASAGKRTRSLSRADLVPLAVLASILILLFWRVLFTGQMFFIAMPSATPIREHDSFTMWFEAVICPTGTLISALASPYSRIQTSSFSIPPPSLSSCCRLDWDTASLRPAIWLGCLWYLSARPALRAEPAVSILCGRCVCGKRSTAVARQSLQPRGCGGLDTLGVTLHRQRRESPLKARLDSAGWSFCPAALGRRALHLACHVYPGYSTVLIRSI